MDRDVALNIVQKLTGIKTAMQLISTGIAETQSVSASLNSTRESNVSLEFPEEPEAPAEEPETRTKK